MESGTFLDMANTETLGTHQKALRVNLDPRRYGTFAEIGAGQEVVRWFFRVGGAAGTVSKSMSAYDMTVSDAIYGKCERYVARSRLESMLEHEHRLNLERLRPVRGGDTAFFAFADTVAARNFKGTNEQHGWMGVLFQARPGDADSRILLHVRMLDPDATLQQEALGIVGVNLLHGAFFLASEPERLVESLLDGLSTSRIEIDLIEFAGSEFEGVDNRVMSLKLVELGLSKAAMFSATGEVLQPSEALRKKTVLVERGSFRPLCTVHVDMLDCARRRLRAQGCGDIVEIMEITTRNLSEESRGRIDVRDFLERSDMIAATGRAVLVTDHPEYFRLGAFLSRMTKERIALVMGARSLLQLFDESYYQSLDGGILEAFGRLFKHDLKLLVYPYLDPESGELVTVANLPVPEPLRHLYAFLQQRGSIEPLDDCDISCLKVRRHDALDRIREGDPCWEAMVPPPVAEAIRRHGLLGLGGGA